MSDPSKKQDDLLSAFDLGPAWARNDAPEKDYKDHKGDAGGDRRGRRQGGGGQGARGDRRGGPGGGRRPDGGGRGNQRDGRRGQGGGRRDGRRDGGKFQRGDRQRQLPQPAPGLKATILPSVEAVHLLVKEIHHRARVYSLFDVANLFLGSKAQCRVEFVLENSKPPMFRGKKSDCLFMTKEEAAAYFMQSEAFGELYETDEVEADPPSGNFQVVARCGISGEWLGPPNFHSYQSNLRRLHRERFSNMPFERYASKVRTERGEEAVEAWLETMKKRVRWRPKGGSDDDWTFERSEIEHDFLSRAFADAFEETHKAELPADVDFQAMSEGVRAAASIAGSHTRRHPAMLIPTICRMLESDHLAIFKTKGKLFCGPARPHPLVDFDSLSERPAAIVKWLDDKERPKLTELWEALLPEGTEEPPKEWLVDLFWLLTQGHVLLFADDALVLPKRSRQGTGKPQSAEAGPKAKKKKRKKRKRTSFRAKRPSHAKVVRSITRMNHGQLKRLRGKSLLWGRRLARRERITALLEE